MSKMMSCKLIRYLLSLTSLFDQKAVHYLQSFDNLGWFCDQEYVFECHLEGKSEQEVPQHASRGVFKAPMIVFAQLTLLEQDFWEQVTDLA